MRRFIAIVTIILIGVIISFYVYVDRTNRSDVDFTFKTVGKDICVRDGENFNIFIPNGVTLTATQPGVIPSGNKVTYETYLKWFALMQDMGINTVKVDALMPGRFYRAFRDYNIEREEPLYLLQGIYFDEVALKDGHSPLDEKWANAFLKDIEATIDSVHGNANLLESIYLFRSDAIDVSDYLIGYVVGVNWGADDIAYSNLKYDLEPFKGDYFYTDEEASSFEHFLAALLDYAAEYEGTNYRHQSIYSVHGHGGFLARQLVNQGNIVEPYDLIRDDQVLNAENIKVNNTIQTGYFVNYDFEQVNIEISDFSYTGEDDQYLNGFDIVLDYHTLPVVISAYGLPTGRYVAEYGNNQKVPYINEQIQSKGVVDQYEYIRSMGVAGQFLRDWQDAWFKSSWYSADLKVLDHSVLWRDVQTYGQGYGIIGFRPSKFENHYLDKSIEEWKELDTLTNTKRSHYKMTHDADGFHFLIKADKRLTTYDTYLIGFDVTPHSGLNYFEMYDVEFEQAVDFVLVLDGSGHYELFVHDYYDVNAFRLNRDLIKRYPDRYILQANGGSFNSIYQLSDDDLLYFRFKDVDDDDIRLTGLLTLGSNNPESQMYNSESDLYLGYDYMELRIPYGLLNFKSPASKLILNDFYKDHVFESYRVEDIDVEFYEKHAFSSYYSGVSVYKWDDWTNPAYETYIKEVYWSLKNIMKGE